MQQSQLELINIQKSFGELTVLKDISFSIFPGECVSLVGENGCGKSTIIKMISGVYQPTAGQIVINNQTYPELQPSEAIDLGIQVIYQDFSLFDNMTVAENLAFNVLLSKNKFFVSQKKIKTIAKQALDNINLSLDLDIKVSRLKTSERQQLAIAKAIFADAKILIMDEPTTSLSNKEIDGLIKLVQSLMAQGVSVIFVSHKLEEVQQLSQRCIFIRDGIIVAQEQTANLTEQQMAYYMTGLSFENQAMEPYDYQSNLPLLKVINLSKKHLFHDVSFELFPGEILAISGVLGCGKNALSDALFGFSAANHGELILNGTAINIQNTVDAKNHQIGCIPQDRHSEGLFEQLDINTNLTTTLLESHSNTIGHYDQHKSDQLAQQFFNDLAIKAPSLQTIVNTLSGGNQQRVVLGKWLAFNPKILILNSPTVGVDIKSKFEIHQMIKERAQQGMSFLLITDDLSEVLNLAHRILIMKQGKIVDEQLNQQLTSTTLSHLIS